MLKALNFDYTEDQFEKIGQLRSLIEADSTLEIGTEDVFLSKFLNFTRWHVGNAHESIHKYYDFKKQHTEWHAQETLSYFEHILFYTQSKFIMPRPDRDGRVIIVFKVIDAFDRFPNYLQDNIQLDDLIFESVLLMKQTQKYGLTLIYDLVHTTRNVRPTITHVLHEKNNIMPWTTHRVHYIQKGVMSGVQEVFKKCLSKNLKDEIFNHDIKNLARFHNLLGYENVPAVYGGPAENVLLNCVLYNHLKENEQYLFKIQKYHKKVVEK